MNPAIKLRTSIEINKEALSSKQRRELINKIYEGKKMRTVLSWQAENGYFGNRMHTPASNSKIWPHEGCIRYLLEMGLSAEDEPLKKAMASMLKPDWGRELSAVGSVASKEFGYEIIRAALFAQAGLYEYDFIKFWAAMSLNAFRCIADAENLMEIVETSRDKYVVRKGRSLPGIYNMRMLAFTDVWRTKANLEMLREAYQKLYRWLPLPAIYIKAKSQLVAPAFTIAQAYNKDFDNNEAFFWLQFYELSARMGMLTTRSPFYTHFSNLIDHITANGFEVLDKADNRYFMSYSGYSGMALEDDWRVKERKREDLIFRIKLIDAITKEHEFS